MENYHKLLWCYLWEMFPFLPPRIPDWAKRQSSATTWPSSRPTQSSLTSNTHTHTCKKDLDHYFCFCLDGTFGLRRSSKFVFFIKQGNDFPSDGQIMFPIRLNFSLETPSNKSQTHEIRRSKMDHSNSIKKNT